MFFFFTAKKSQARLNSMSHFALNNLSSVLCYLKTAFLLIEQIEGFFSFLFSIENLPTKNQNAIQHFSVELFLSRKISIQNVLSFCLKSPPPL